MGVLTEGIRPKGVRALHWFKDRLANEASRDNSSEYKSVVVNDFISISLSLSIRNIFGSASAKELTASDKVRMLSCENHSGSRHRALTASYTALLSLSAKEHTSFVHGNVCHQRGRSASMH
ncbi:hypothetical protein TRVL_02349 [Trypanosoma vivax]|nr:hypothetical protein TRVL_02349 [Trypanosoma vivax]